MKQQLLDEVVPADTPSHACSASIGAVVLCLPEPNSPSLPTCFTSVPWLTANCLLCVVNQAQDPRNTKTLTHANSQSSQCNSSYCCS